jgi:sugar (pentulose or hexulose) kinase
MAAKNYLAFDLGAESGRAVLATLQDGKVALAEKHRFANPWHGRPARVGDVERKWRLISRCSLGLHTARMGGTPMPHTSRRPVRVANARRSSQVL